MITKFDKTGQILSIIKCTCPGFNAKFIHLEKPIKMSNIWNTGKLLSSKVFILGYALLILIPVPDKG